MSCRVHLPDEDARRSSRWSGGTVGRVRPQRRPSAAAGQMDEAALLRAQAAQLQQQYEQRVREAHAAGVREGEAAGARAGGGARCSR